MGYSKNKNRSKGKFIMLRHDIYDSEAWRSLSPKARCVWLELARRYNGINNGDIGLSNREAGKACNISKNTGGKALIELEEKGFIKVTAYSGFKNKYRVANRYALTHERYQDKPPTNEWRNWKPEKQNTVS